MNKNRIQNSIKYLRLEGLRRKNLIRQKLSEKVKTMENTDDLEYRNLLSKLQRILYAIKALERFEDEI
jgi:hypothetical protein